MRIALIYNAEAGAGVYDKADLITLLKQSGYEVASLGPDDGDVRAAVEQGCDCLVVSGGDGTVARVSIELHKLGASTPLYILPTGTSNNIARSLGFDAPTPLLVKALHESRETHFDIGCATLNGASEPFVESAGVGFIGSMLHKENSLSTRIEKLLRNIRRDAWEFEMAARGVARLVRSEAARRYDIRADGEDVSGEYITVEVLNIRAVGPRTHLAPHADAGDGLLDLLRVPVAGRDLLADHILSMSEGHALPGEWYRRVGRVELSWFPGCGHLDDNPWPKEDSDASGRAIVEMSGSIKVLQPPS